MVVVVVGVLNENVYKLTIIIIIRFAILTRGFFFLGGWGNFCSARND